MDAQYYINNNPFKKPEVSAASRIKQTLGVILVLGCFVFWGMSATPTMDVREEAVEARGVLQPLQAAPARPGGGGIANMTAAPSKAAADEVVAAASKAVTPTADEAASAAPTPSATVTPVEQSHNRTAS
mmetsp:Transcript_32824/g.86274  ORF Transcript_32824/g.86274 Transcript_32824/m.86274 type:complete len:129 (+) Transcript_32824:137-523(+)|eukprot:CAMPEP_0115835318 /NCGR_PEP_ID=MMETSP0287-20121206/4132_1 /TAXON_ID=412157 /ORGANISM="Chrysochromulina rotalis, Strain UIO044" /LENGTH=128 /DNA_ID=CAMNT_0003288771 /DNA_START=88 /DNA_END=474 /DNA_ORIENTATION=+